MTEGRLEVESKSQECLVIIKREFTSNNLPKRRVLSSTHGVVGGLRLVTASYPINDIQLNSCCIVKCNPAGTGFQLTPAFGRACALFCFNDGENSLAGEPACCGVVRAGTFADVQI